MFCCRKFQSQVIHIPVFLGVGIEVCHQGGWWVRVGVGVNMQALGEQV